MRSASSIGLLLGMLMAAFLVGRMSVSSPVIVLDPGIEWKISAPGEWKVFVGGIPLTDPAKSEKPPEGYGPEGEFSLFTLEEHIDHARISTGGCKKPEPRAL